MLRKAIALAAATSSVAAYSNPGLDASFSGLDRRDLVNELLERRLNFKRDLYGESFQSDGDSLYAREAEAEPFVDHTTSTTNTPYSNNSARGSNNKSENNSNNSAPVYNDNRDNRQDDNRRVGSNSNDSTAVQKQTPKYTKYHCEGKLVISHPESTVVKRGLDEDGFEYSLNARDAEPFMGTSSSTSTTVSSSAKPKSNATAFVCHGQMVPVQPKAKRDLYEDDFDFDYGLYAREAEPEAYPAIPVPAKHADLSPADKARIYNSVMKDRFNAHTNPQPAPAPAPGKPKARRDLFDDEDMFELFARDADPEAAAPAPAKPAPAAAAKPVPKLLPYVPPPPAKPAPAPAKVAAPAAAKPAAAKPAPAKPAPAKPKREVEFDEDMFATGLYAREADAEARGGFVRAASRVPWKKIGHGVANAAQQYAAQNYQPNQNQYQSQAPPPTQDSYANQGNGGSAQWDPNQGNYNRRDVAYSAEEDFPFALYSREAEAEAEVPQIVHARDVDGGSISFTNDWYARDAHPEAEIDAEFAELLARDLADDEYLFEREAEPEMSEYEALFEPEAWF